MRDGNTIPVLGFGTYQIYNPDVFRRAYEAGYRHFDSATMYGNLDKLATGLSSFDRSSYFVTSKIQPPEMGTKPSKDSLEYMLQFWDYLDLVLIHWPGGGKQKRQETWRVMESYVAAGKVKSIGVSNFMQRHLETIEEIATVPCCINQMEYHPLCQNPELLQYCKDAGIHMEAYSPFGEGLRQIINSGPLGKIGEKYGKTACQVTLRWLLDQGIIPLPKAATQSHQVANMQVFDFALEPQDTQAIMEMNEDRHTDWDPTNVN